MKRAILLIENGKVIFRFDSENHGKDNIELDFFRAISDLEKSKNNINSKKLMNMLKTHHGLNLSDTMDVFKNIDDWRFKK